MGVRTYFWHTRIVSRPRLMWHQLRGRDPARYFYIGNAGDIITRDIIRMVYEEAAINAKESPRLLLVGSIAPHMRTGDLICGIGCKGVVPSRDEAQCRIFGLRGPLSYDAFKAAGHDLSEVGFLKDPGLLIRELVANPERPAVRGRTLFIPHFRERTEYKRGLPSGIQFCDIDADPAAIGEKILDAELVYSSSLHGVIFCHALGRPCVLVSPQTEEPEFKYKDYFASVDVPYQKPFADIFAAAAAPKPTSPANVRISREDFKFPSADVLRETGVLV